MSLTQSVRVEPEDKNAALENVGGETEKSVEEFESLLTPEESAAILSVTPGTLAVWRSTNRYCLPYIKIGGRVMYRPSDLHKFLAERLVTPVTVSAAVVAARRYVRRNA